MLLIYVSLRFRDLATYLSLSTPEFQSRLFSLQTGQGRPSSVVGQFSMNHEPAGP